MKKLFLHPSWRRIIFFFPFQLVFLHLKKNLLLVSFWALLFGFVTQSIAPHYGVAYLFLNPEYMDDVNFVTGHHWVSVLFSFHMMVNFPAGISTVAEKTLCRTSRNSTPAER
jgi:hypothetical protein